MNDVVSYYDQLAETYDADRFGGSYGKFVDAREREMLRRWLPDTRHARILDLGCGTGRLLDLATHGQDPSENMLRKARIKFPTRVLEKSSLESRIYFDIQFDAIFSLHVFMHLRVEVIRRIVEECHAHLQPGGSFIFDIPSAERRRIWKHTRSGWHGNTALSQDDIERLAGDSWKWHDQNGVLFLPIHRTPAWARVWLRGLDALGCRSVLGRFASYRLIHFQRQP